MICHICGLDVGKVEIVSKRGEIVFICSKCNSKKQDQEKGEKNE